METLVLSWAVARALKWGQGEEVNFSFNFTVIFFKSSSKDIFFPLTFRESKKGEQRNINVRDTSIG